MLQDMKRVAELTNGELSDAESILLVVAFKNAMDEWRTEWYALLDDALKTWWPSKKKVVKQYQEKLGAEIHRECIELVVRGAILKNCCPEIYFEKIGIR